MTEGKGNITISSLKSMISSLPKIFRMLSKNFLVALDYFGEVGSYTIKIAKCSDSPQRI